MQSLYVNITWALTNYACNIKWWGNKSIHEHWDTQPTVYKLNQLVLTCKFIAVFLSKYKIVYTIVRSEVSALHLLGHSSQATQDVRWSERRPPLPPRRETPCDTPVVEGHGQTGDAICQLGTAWDEHQGEHLVDECGVSLLEHCRVECIVTVHVCLSTINPCIAKRYYLSHIITYLLSLRCQRLIIGEHSPITALWGWSERGHGFSREGAAIRGTWLWKSALPHSTTLTLTEGAKQTYCNITFCT